MKLIIGNKNYSSWSLRPWLAMRQTGIVFDEVFVSLYRPESKQRILRYSPAGKVPVLIDDQITVWESLAICEYLAERFPARRLWPEDAASRAHARAISTEMHAGFANLRANMFMHVRGRFPGKGRAPGVEEDIARILEIWRDCRERYRAVGDFLFGRFSIADAMYAPVVLRFVTYGVALPPVAGDYAHHMTALPAMQDWLAAAKAETETIADYEVYATGA